MRATTTGDGLEQQRRQESLELLRPRLAPCKHRDSALGGRVGAYQQLITIDCSPVG